MKSKYIYLGLIGLSVLSSLAASLWVAFGKSPFKSESDFKFFQLILVFFVLAVLAGWKLMDSVRSHPVLTIEGKNPEIITLESGQKLEINPHGCCVSCCFLPVCSSAIMVSEMNYSSSPVKITENEMKELELMCQCDDCNYKILE